PDRRLGHARVRHAAARDDQARRQEGPGHAVHRRRHGHRHVRCARLSAATFGKTRRAADRRPVLHARGRRGGASDQGPATVIAPSIFRVTPAMLLASSEARNTAAAAISSAVARRRSGVRCRRASQPAWSITVLAPGVETGPGASALTRMPCAPSSTACWRVSVSSAPLIELYTAAFLIANETATEDRLITQP